MNSIIKDIKYLRGILKTTNFGAPVVRLFSDIDWNGKIIHPREGQSGFFYEIPPYGAFLPGSDLHISIFDDSGFAKAHVTFKPYRQGDLAFHYGYKLKYSKYEEFWITGINTYDFDTTSSIMNEIQNLYYSVLEKIYINRPDLTPYKFNLRGTAGRIHNSAQKRFALEEYRQQNRSPPDYLKPGPGYLKPKKIIKKRLSEFFKKPPRPGPGAFDD